MLKKVTGIFAALILSLNIAACTSQKDKSLEANNIDSSSKINVVVSFNPMKELTKAIGGDKIQMSVMVPSGVEAHDFEPKPRDMEALNKAKVFIYNGLGMEGWVDGALKSVNNKSLELVDASKGANLIKIEKHEEEHKENSKEVHGEYDPHIWLSIKEVKVQAKNIKEALIKADEKNKDYYENNYNSFISKADDLFKEYETKFSSIANKNFVTGHAAFGYLCRDFNLSQNSVEDVFAEGEATAVKIKDLVEYCKKNNIKTIFMEEMASPKVSETLAKEVGAKVEVINTLENEGDYLETMKQNYEKIYNSLK